jgi:pyruvate,water dikinase
MMNVGNPQLAFDFCQLPNEGVGLARLEFIINNNIGVHPKAILDYPNIDADLKKAVESGGARPRQPARLLRRQGGRGRGHHRRRLLAQAGDRAPVGLQEQRIPQADRRQPLRAGGRKPDAGLPRRGALHQPEFAEAFAMECEALKRVRDEMGLTNVQVMVPFVRTLAQAERVVALLAQQGPEARRQRACA